MSAGLVGNSQAHNNSGQGLSPAPFQNGASENEQGFYSDIQPVSGNADSTAGNSSDRKNEVENEKTLANAFSRPGSNSDALLVSCGISDSGSSQKNNSALREVNQNDRNQETENLFQDKQSGILGSNPAADSFSGGNAQPDNRGVNFEVKNAQTLESLTGSNSNNCGNDHSGQLGQINDSNPSDYFGLETQSARIASPANQASFDAGNYSLPHVQNEQEKQETVTCAKSPEVEEKPNRLTGRELTEWAIKNYAVDPVKSSKNRWKIRLRCRKTGCQHFDHLHLKTISFMSDSAFKKLIRSERKYELWKKATIAENAKMLRIQKSGREPESEEI